MQSDCVDVHGRDAIDARRLEFFDRNTLHNIFVDNSLIVVSRREHGLSSEGKLSFFVGTEGIQAGRDAVNEVSQVLPGDDKIARNAHQYFGERADGTSPRILLSAVANPHLPLTELPVVSVALASTQHSHDGLLLKQQHLYPEERLVDSDADHLGPCPFRTTEVICPK